MTLKSEADEIAAIVKRTTNNLLSFIGMEDRKGAELRYAVGDLNANMNKYIADGTLAKRLMLCFAIATDAGMTLLFMDHVLEQLAEEEPISLPAMIVTENSLMFALAQDGRIIAATEYKSRDDIDATMRKMKDWFDVIKDIVADRMDGPTYEALLDLMAAITRFLTDVARPLPRMVQFETPTPLPALAASQYIYADGSRAEEIAAENKIVHPAFCRRELRALSA
jgi:prophage DNA circulation protein